MDPASYLEMEAVRRPALSIEFFVGRAPSASAGIGLVLTCSGLVQSVATCLAAVMPYSCCHEE